MLPLPYLAYITVEFNLVDWAALVAQLAEHWTNNPVVMGSNPSEAAQCFFHCVPLDFALVTFPCFNFMYM